MHTFIIIRSIFFSLLFVKQDNIRPPVTETDNSILSVIAKNIRCNFKMKCNFSREVHKFVIKPAIKSLMKNRSCREPSK
jgi:hypothetical protein